jgi:hypothetical protein
LLGCAADATIEAATVARVFEGIQPIYGIELEDVDEANRCRGSNGGRCGARRCGGLRWAYPA